MEIKSISTGAVNEVWDELLYDLLGQKPNVSPRGMAVREYQNVHILMHSPRSNILIHPMRRPSYRFMLAEFLWIWFGHNDVKTISRYNSHISQFSDNGIDFNGSYGVPVTQQWRRVLSLLLKDPDTRQAVIQIYKTPAGPTKDVPCTLSLQFLIRDNSLQLIVNMRSSDVWLGLPYDIFNFTMLQNVMAAQLRLRIGEFALNLGSSHLYERNVSAANKVIEAGPSTSLRSPAFRERPPLWLDSVLQNKITKAFNASLLNMSSPWYHYSNVLRATTNAYALTYLKDAANA